MFLALFFVQKSGRILVTLGGATSSAVFGAASIPLETERKAEARRIMKLLIQTELQALAQRVWPPSRSKGIWCAFFKKPLHRTSLTARQQSK